MSKPRKKKPGIHHQDTRIISSSTGGHNYIVAHHAGQEAEAIKAIGDWCSNPELNLAEEEADAMVKKIKGVTDFEAMKAKHTREREGRKRGGK